MMTPSNMLYYFMPYIKEKGVRDLYLIRVARIGNKAFTLNKIWLDDHAVKKPYPRLKEEDGMMKAAEKKATNATYAAARFSLYSAIPAAGNDATNVAIAQITQYARKVSSVCK